MTDLPHCQPLPPVVGLLPCPLETACQTAESHCSPSRLCAATLATRRRCIYEEQEQQYIIILYTVI